MTRFTEFIVKFNSESDETTKSITNLTDNLSKSDKNKEIIPSLILKIINDFNNYLNKININDKNDKDNRMIELLNICIESYNRLGDKTLAKNIINIIETIPDKISCKLEAIIQCFHNIPYEIFLSNSVLTYYFNYLIYKCILIYYTYNIYIQNIILLFSTKITELSDQSSTDMKQVSFSDFSRSISISTGYTYLGVADDTKFFDIESNYNAIINKFIKEILLVKASDNVPTTISIDLIYSQRKYILKHILNSRDVKQHYVDNETIGRDYIDDNGLIRDEFIIPSIESYKRKIYKYILKNYNILKIVSENVTNDFITIPQYTGICWFSSMLTGMCYSDYSRELINSKIESSIPSYKNKSDELFINIVKRILEVSTNFLRYSENLHTHCKLFKFFKYKLTDYLMARLNEVKEEKKQDGEYIEQSLSVGDNDYYYINKLNMILNDPKEDIRSELNGVITTFDKMGIAAGGTFILESLYKILGIKSLFIITNNKDMYKKKDYIIDKTDNPDIIIIETIVYDNSSDLIEKVNITDDVEMINSHGFIYNKEQYKLDYRLYSADSLNNVCTKEGCGHCVSSIQYNGKQYYYDSGKARKTLNEKGECADLIRIPCSLIRQDWINPLIDETSIDKKHFYMNECFYRDVDVSTDFIKIEYKFEQESDALFSKEDNIISVYVKVPEGEVPDGEVAATSGGKNNTYKSTHKKVNIMNKNKTIIERIVYIDKNKNKFIKFNKKYESLSTFKYNRKNKYYFI
jgi:hypothetical protein